MQPRFNNVGKDSLTGQPHENILYFRNRTFLCVFTQIVVLIEDLWKIGIVQLIFLFKYVLFSFMPFQDYFSSYETGQSIGWAKTVERREKPPDTPARRTWLDSHVARAGIEPTMVKAVMKYQCS